MTLIPGYLCVKLMKFETTGKIQTLLYSFSLSLLINYLMVYLLTFLKLYKPTVLYLILLVEGALLLYIMDFKRDKQRLTFEKKTGFFTSFLAENPGYSLVFIITLTVFYTFASHLLSSLGSVFSAWDAVVSWNRWAVSWSHNSFPALTWHYPQLIPTNWSLAYVFMGNSTVQFFSKPLMALFPILTLLLFFDLALKKREYVYLLGLIFYGKIIQHYFDPDFIVSGYVDLAVSFFMFLTLYAMIAGRQKEQYSFRSIFLINIFAATAALTKQSGLFILLLVLVWDIHAFFLKVSVITLKKKAPAFFLLVGSVMLLLFGYIEKEVEISKGKDRSELAYVTHDIHRGKTVYQRLEKGLSFLIKKSTGDKIFFFCLVFLLLISVFHKNSRLVFIFFVIPFFLIWGMFYSYDLRNLAPVLPFAAYSGAFGLVVLIKKVKQVLPKNLQLSKIKLKSVHFIILLLPTLLLFNFKVFTRSSLMDYQIKIMAREKTYSRQSQNIEIHQGVLANNLFNYKLTNYMSQLTTKSDVEEYKVWFPRKINKKSISPSLLIQGIRGKFNLNFKREDNKNILHVQLSESGPKGQNIILFGYSANEKGFNLNSPQGKFVHFILQAKISKKLLNKNNHMFIQDFTGNWEKECIYFQGEEWHTYLVSKKIRFGSSKIVMGIRFVPETKKDKISIKEMRVTVSKDPLY
jgi:hypothetical protein